VERVCKIFNEDRRSTTVKVADKLGLSHRTTSKRGPEPLVDIGEDYPSTALRRAEVAEYLCASTCLSQRRLKSFSRVIQETTPGFKIKTQKPNDSRLSAQNPPSQRAKK